MSSSIDHALYWIQPGTNSGACVHTRKGLLHDLSGSGFSLRARPGEKELRAIDGMREVYGVRRVQFNDQERTVRVEFDASRLKADAVARLLREAGVDVRERLALA